MAGTKGPDGPDGWDGPVLSSKGKVEGKPAPPVGAPPPPRLQPVEAPMELERVREHRTSDFVPPDPLVPPARAPRPGSRLPVLLVLALAAAGGVWWWVHGRPGLPQAGGPSGPGTVMITSEPSGATVRIEGVTVGETPYATDNLYEGTAVRVELTLRGHQPWHGTFPGGKAARVEARLPRR